MKRWSPLALVLTACTSREPDALEEPACSDIGPGELVLTEVMANPNGDDAGKEYFEAHNTSGRDLDLAGLELIYRRDELAAPESFHLREGRVDAGEFVVFGGVLPDLAPEHVDYAYADAFELRNSGGILALACGGVEVDSGRYPAVSRQGVPYSFHGNAVVEYCGEDGGEREPVRPRRGDLVITEFLADPMAVADSTGEWVEILALADVDLNGVAIGRSTGSGVQKAVLSSESCLAVRRGEHALFVRSEDSAKNGGLPAARARLGSLSLPNGKSALFVELGGVRLDEMTWSRTTPGASLALDPARTNPDQNDDEQAWSVCTATYGAGDRGTPGAANTGCAP